MRKKILIYTNHFYPEAFKVNDVAFFLSDQQCDVTVVTGIPNYPKGEFFEGYGLFLKNKEKIQNINVIRLPLIPRKNGTKFWLTANYLSYAVIAFLHSFYLAYSKKFDSILVHHTSPIFIAIPAIIVKKIQKIKLVLWNLDMWPEAVLVQVGSEKGYLFRGLLKMVKWIYRQCDHMLIASKEYLPIMIERGVAKDKISYFPNWPEDIFFDSKRPILPFDLPTGFNIVYAGNIGNTQDFESVVNAIHLVKDKNINWIFVGDGRKKKWLQDKVIEQGLTHCVFIKNRISLNQVPTLYSQADALFASLVDMPLFTIPLKVTTYLTSGKPIICMMNGEGKELIEEQKCGYSCGAGDFYALAEIAEKLASSSPGELTQMGKNGLEHCLKYFHPDLFKSTILSLFNSSDNAF